MLEEILYYRKWWKFHFWNFHKVRISSYSLDFCFPFLLKLSGYCVVIRMMFHALCIFKLHILSATFNKWIYWWECVFSSKCKRYSEKKSNLKSQRFASTIRRIISTTWNANSLRYKKIIPLSTDPVLFGAYKQTILPVP